MSFFFSAKNRSSGKGYVELACVQELSEEATVFSWTVVHPYGCAAERVCSLTGVKPSWVCSLAWKGFLYASWMVAAILLALDLTSAKNRRVLECGRGVSSVLLSRIFFFRVKPSYRPIRLCFSSSQFCATQSCWMLCTMVIPIRTFHYALRAAAIPWSPDQDRSLRASLLSAPPPPFPLSSPFHFSDFSPSVSCDLGFNTNRFRTVKCHTQTWTTKFFSFLPNMKKLFFCPPRLRRNHRHEESKDGWALLLVRRKDLLTRISRTGISWLFLVSIFRQVRPSVLTSFFIFFQRKHAI